MSALLAKITLSKLTALLIGVNVAIEFGSTIFDHLDTWAPTANTLLLIVLAIVAHRNSVKIDDTHTSVHATANTAAAAAVAATEAARVAKSIGSTLRQEQVPARPRGWLRAR